MVHEKYYSLAWHILKCIIDYFNLQMRNNFGLVSYQRVGRDADYEKNE